MGSRPISPRIDALDMFVRLARTRNQPAVAAEMGCNQPVVSRQIAALANWLGCDLTKGASPVRLTEDGERFAIIAAEVLEQLREFRAGPVVDSRTDGGNIVARRVSPISDR